MEVSVTFNCFLFTFILFLGRTVSHMTFDSNAHLSSFQKVDSNLLQI